MDEAERALLITVAKMLLGLFRASDSRHMIIKDRLSAVEAKVSERKAARAAHKALGEKMILDRFCYTRADMTRWLEEEALWKRRDEG